MACYRVRCNGSGYPTIPVFTFKKLDVTGDGLIDIDDIVKIIVDPNLQFDIIQDGIFDREDVQFLLSQITSLTVEISV